MTKIILFNNLENIHAKCQYNQFIKASYFSTFLQREYGNCLLFAIFELKSSGYYQ